MPNWYDPSQHQDRAVAEIDPGNPQAQTAVGPNPGTAGAWVRLTRGANKGKIVFHYLPLPSGAEFLSESDLAEIMTNGGASRIASSIAATQRNQAQSAGVTADPHGVMDGGVRAAARAVTTKVTGGTTVVPGQLGLPVQVNADGSIVINSAFGDNRQVMTGDADAVRDIVRDVPLVLRRNDGDLLLDSETGVRILTPGGIHAIASSLLHVVHGQVRDTYQAQRREPQVEQDRDLGELWADPDNGLSRNQEQFREAQDAQIDQNLRDEGFLERAEQHGRKTGRRPADLGFVDAASPYVAFIRALTKVTGNIPVETLVSIFQSSSLSQINFSVKDKKGNYILPHEILREMFGLSSDKVAATVAGAIETLRSSLGTFDSIQKDLENALKLNKLTYSNPENINKFIKQYILSAEERGLLSSDENAEKVASMASFYQRDSRNDDRFSEIRLSNSDVEEVVATILALKDLCNVFGQRHRTIMSQSSTTMSPVLATEQVVENFHSASVPVTNADYSAHIQTIEQWLAASPTAAVAIAADTSLFDISVSHSYDAEIDNDWNSALSNFFGSQNGNGLNLPFGTNPDGSIATAKTSEHWYQAAKFKFNSDGSVSELQKDILSKATPAEAKQAAHAYLQQYPNQNSRPPSVSAERHNLDIMWAAISTKYEHCERFRQALQNCGPIIVESSPRDSYWGAVRSFDGQQRVGKNVLGKMLMQLRSDKSGMDLQQAMELANAEIQQYLSINGSKIHTELLTATYLMSSRFRGMVANQSIMSARTNATNRMQRLIRELFPTPNRAAPKNHRKIQSAINKSLNKFANPADDKNQPVNRVATISTSDVPQALHVADLIALALMGISQTNMSQEIKDNIKDFANLFANWNILDRAHKFEKIGTSIFLRRNREPSVNLTQNNIEVIRKGLNALGIIDTWFSANQGTYYDDSIEDFQTGEFLGRVNPAFKIFARNIDQVINVATLSNIPVSFDDYVEVKHSSEESHILYPKLNTNDTFSFSSLSAALLAASSINVQWNALTLGEVSSQSMAGSIIDKSASLRQNLETFRTALRRIGTTRPLEQIPGRAGSKFKVGITYRVLRRSPTLPAALQEGSFFTVTAISSEGVQDALSSLPYKKTLFTTSIGAKGVSVEQTGSRRIILRTSIDADPEESPEAKAIRESFAPSLKIKNTARRTMGLGAQSAKKGRLAASTEYMKNFNPDSAIAAILRYAETHESDHSQIGLACFEDLSAHDQFCHRRFAARRLSEMLGVPIPDSAHIHLLIRALRPQMMEFYGNQITQIDARIREIKDEANAERARKIEYNAYGYKIEEYGDVPVKDMDKAKRLEIEYLESKKSEYLNVSFDDPITFFETHILDPMRKVSKVLGLNIVTDRNNPDLIRAYQKYIPMKKILEDIIDRRDQLLDAGQIMNSSILSSNQARTGEYDLKVPFWNWHQEVTNKSGSSVITVIDENGNKHVFDASKAMMHSTGSDGSSFESCTGNDVLSLLSEIENKINNNVVPETKISMLLNTPENVLIENFWDVDQAKIIIQNSMSKNFPQLTIQNYLAQKNNSDILREALQIILEELSENGGIWTTTTAEAFSNIFHKKIDDKLKILLSEYMQNNQYTSGSFEPLFSAHITRLINEMNKKGITFISWADTRFPSVLRTAPSVDSTKQNPAGIAPSGLWVLGNQSALDQRANSVCLINDPLPVATIGSFGSEQFILGKNEIIAIADTFISCLSAANSVNLRYSAQALAIAIMNAVNTATEWGIQTNTHIPLAPVTVTWQKLAETAQELYALTEGNRNGLDLQSPIRWQGFATLAKQSIPDLLDTLDVVHDEFLKNNNVENWVQTTLLQGKTIVLTQVGSSGSASDFENITANSKLRRVYVARSLDKDIYKIVRAVQYGYTKKINNGQHASDSFLENNYSLPFEYMGQLFRSVEAAFAASMFAHPLLDRTAPDHEALFRFFGSCTDSSQIERAITAVRNSSWSTNMSSAPHPNITRMQYFSAFNSDGSPRSDWEKNKDQILYEIILTRIMQHESLQQELKTAVLKNNHLIMAKNHLLAQKGNLSTSGQGGVLVLPHSSSCAFPMTGMDANTSRKATSVASKMVFMVPWQDAYSLITSSVPKYLDMSRAVVSSMEPLVMDVELQDQQWLQKTNADHMKSGVANERINGNLTPDLIEHTKRTEMTKLALSRNFVILKLSALSKAMYTQHEVKTALTVQNQLQRGDPYFSSLNLTWRMMNMFQRYATRTLKERMTFAVSFLGNKVGMEIPYTILPKSFSIDSPKYIDYHEFSLPDSIDVSGWTDAKVIRPSMPTVQTSVLQAPVTQQPLQIAAANVPTIKNEFLQNANLIDLGALGPLFPAQPNNPSSLTGTPVSSTDSLEGTIAFKISLPNGKSIFNFDANAKTQLKIFWELCKNLVSSQPGASRDTAIAKIKEFWENCAQNNVFKFQIIRSGKTPHSIFPTIVPASTLINPATHISLVFDGVSNNGKIYGSFDKIPEFIRKYLSPDSTNPNQTLDLYNQIILMDLSHLLSPLITLSDNLTPVESAKNAGYIYRFNNANANSNFKKMQDSVTSTNVVISSQLPTSYQYYGSPRPSGTLQVTNEPSLQQYLSPTAMQRNDASTIIVENILSLTPAERKAIIISYWQGKTIIEIGTQGTAAKIWKKDSVATLDNWQKLQTLRALGSIMIQDGVSINPSYGTMSGDDRWLSVLRGPVLGYDISGQPDTAQLLNTMLLRTDESNQVYEKAIQYIAGTDFANTILKINSDGITIGNKKITIKDSSVLAKISAIWQNRSNQYQPVQFDDENMNKYPCVKLADRIAAITQQVSRGSISSNANTAFRITNSLFYIADFLSREYDSSFAETILQELSENIRKYIEEWIRVAKRDGQDDAEVVQHFEINAGMDRSIGTSRGRTITSLPLNTRGRMDMLDPSAFVRDSLSGEFDDGIYGTGLHSDNNLLVSSAITDSEIIAQLNPQSVFTLGRRVAGIVPVHSIPQSVVNSRLLGDNHSTIVSVDPSAQESAAFKQYKIGRINNFQIVEQYSYSNRLAPNVRTIVSVGRHVHRVAQVEQGDCMQVDTYYVVETFATINENEIKISDLRYVQPYRFYAKDKDSLYKYRLHERSMANNIAKEILTGVITDHISSLFSAFHRGTDLRLYPKSYAPGIHPIGRQHSGSVNVPQDHIVFSSHIPFTVLPRMKSQDELFPTGWEVSEKSLVPISSREKPFALRSNFFSNMNWEISSDTKNFLQNFLNTITEDSIRKAEHFNILNYITGKVDKRHVVSGGFRPAPLVIANVGKNSGVIHNIGRLLTAYSHDPKLKEIENEIEIIKNIVNSPQPSQTFNNFVNALMIAMSTAQRNIYNRYGHIKMMAPVTEGAYKFVNFSAEKEPYLLKHAFPQNPFFSLARTFLQNVLAQRGSIITMPGSWISFRNVPVFFIRKFSGNNIPIKANSPYVILGGALVSKHITPLCWALGSGQDYQVQDVFSENRAKAIGANENSDLDSLPNNFQTSAMLVLGIKSASVPDFRLNFVLGLYANVIHGENIDPSSITKNFFISESSDSNNGFYSKLKKVFTGDDSERTEAADLFMNYICNSLGYDVEKLSLVQKRAVTFAVLYARASSMPADYMFQDISRVATANRNFYRNGLLGKMNQMADAAAIYNMLPEAPQDYDERRAAWKDQPFRKIIDTAYLLATNSSQISSSSANFATGTGFSPSAFQPDTNVSQNELDQSIELLAPFTVDSLQRSPQASPHVANAAGMYILSSSGTAEQKMFAQILIELQKVSYPQEITQGNAKSIVLDIPQELGKLGILVNGQIKHINYNVSSAPTASQQSLTMEDILNSDYLGLASRGRASTAYGNWLNSTNLVLESLRYLTKSNIEKPMALFVDIPIELADLPTTPEWVKSLQTFSKTEQKINESGRRRTVVTPTSKRGLIVISEDTFGRGTNPRATGGLAPWIIRTEHGEHLDESEFLQTNATQISVQVATSYDLGKKVSELMDYQGSRRRGEHSGFFDLMQYFSGLAIDHRTAHQMPPIDTEIRRKRPAILPAGQDTSLEDIAPTTVTNRRTNMFRPQFPRT